MRILFLDCIAGFSGGKLVGALCDLGVKPSALEWELSKLDLGDFHLHFDRPDGEGIRFGIHAGATHTHDQDEHEHGGGCCGGEHEHDHGDHHHHHHHHHEATEQEHGDGCCGHEHEHEGHHHGEHHDCRGGHGAHEEETRRLGDLLALLEGSDLSPFVKEKSLAIFRRIATAQANLSKGSPEEITLSPADALASVAQIVGSCVGLEQLGVERVLASPLRGSQLSPLVPVILNNPPIEPTGSGEQTISPVGAGILAELATSFGAAPASLTVEKTGYGWGSSKASGKLAAILGNV